MKSFSLSRCVIAVVLACMLFSTLFAADQNLNTFLAGVKRSLERKDIPGYLKALSPNLRVREKAALSSRLNDLGFDSLSVYKARGQKEQDNQARVYFQVIFRNAFSVFIEIWRLDLVKASGSWWIVQKTITGDVSNFYSLKIPSKKMERVDMIEINHMDISLSFKNALVFYDNIPDFETAILVIGSGHITYSPSVEREKHQLALVLKKSELRDGLNYAYLRFSNSFFLKNIKIRRSRTSLEPVSEADKNKAHSIFSRHYPRSFTIENSLTGELLSSLPQGDESVFEFQTRHFGIFTYIYSPYAEEEVYFFQWRKKRMLNLYSPALKNKGKRLFIQLGRRYDIKDLRLEIDFNPKEKFISGRAQIDVKSETGIISLIKLKLNPSLEILSITDEEKNSLFYTQDKLRKNLYVYFLHPVARYKMKTIEIFYRGVLQPPEMTSDVITTTQLREDAISLTGPPRLDTYLYSRSAFWYPEPDGEDYFTSRLKIIVPAKYRVISNGDLVEQYIWNGLRNVEDVEKIGRSVYVFQMRNPVRYLAFIVGQFRKIAEDLNGIPVQYFRAGNARTPKYDLVAEAKSILNFYQELFGPFPFHKFCIAHRVWLRSGGHSPPSFVILNDLARYPGLRPLIEKSGPVNLTEYKEYFLAHEIAHQWWGQGVGWDTYHDQWLSEGLAQFATILYLKHKHGEDVYSRILKKFSKWTIKESKWGQITLGSRISFFNFEAYQTIVYSKSSLALVMLKDMLGDAVFFRGLRNFYRKNQYSSARSSNFFKIMSEAAGHDLDAFFQMWFNSYQLPEVHATSSVAKTGNKYNLSFTIQQRTALFVFPLMLEWQEGKKTVQRRVLIDRKGMNFVYSLSQRPKKIKINPGRRVPGKFRLD